MSDLREKIIDILNWHVINGDEHDNADGIFSVVREALTSDESLEAYALAVFGQQYNLWKSYDQYEGREDGRRGITAALDAVMGEGE
jgi:hypothetical protein